MNVWKVVNFYLYQRAGNGREDCMQSGGNLLVRCACAVRGAVMGCCYSLCHKDDDVQENCINERTRLLVEPVREDAPPLRATAAAAAPRKHDEQSVLNRILVETATNVIDVGALGPHALEPHEYSERVRTYQSKLGAAAAPPPPPPRLLKDVSQAERTAALTQEPIAAGDRQLIHNAVKKASAAMSELRVEHREDLVVPFHIP